MTCAKDIAHGLVSVAPKNIEIDGVPLNTTRLADIEEDLAERTEAEDANKPDIYTIEGMFKVLSINYEKSVTLMKAIHVESGKEFDDILLQDGWMTTENMTILDNAQERTPVFFRVICERKRRRFIHTIDVNSIAKQKQTI